MSGARDVIALREAWVDHPYFRYRGCAPDPDDPSRMAGDPSLPVGAHHAPDTDGGEPQAERIAREAAVIEVCLNCPVMVACDAYASSVVVVDGTARVAEPEGVWGGRRSLERHHRFVEHRHEVVAAASDAALRTKQKLAVVGALAVETDPYRVAARAGVDVRTANWQRSSLVTKLGLARDVSRMRLLAVARERGLLDAGTVVVPDDGSVPAVAPPTRMPDPEPVPAAVDLEPDPDPDPVGEGGGGGGPLRLQSPRRDRFTEVSGQLALWEAELSGLAPVHDLFPSEPLEAAA